ncbi:MAG: ROK family protein [Brevinema sp.]
MALLEHQRKSKEYTIKRVFRECLRHQVFTGIHIGDILNISKPTINEVLSYLETMNLIMEQGYTQGNIGRKAKKFQVNPTPWLSLAIEIDIKTIKLALVNLYGTVFHLTIIDKLVLKTETFVEVMIALIRDYLNDLPNEMRQIIKSCSISVPGDISFDRKKIVYATNMNLKNLDITLIEQDIQLPIYLENEANCGALAEFYFSKNSEQTLLYISISDQGVGGGYIIDGKLQKGANRKGGEIGHFTIAINGKPCSCGNLGCFERYTSNQALLMLLEEHGFKYNSLEEALHDYSNDHIIRQYCHYLGRGIRSLIAILDPIRIVIGGEISKYSHRIESYIDTEVFTNNNFVSSLQLEYAGNKELTSLIGAGLLSFLPMIYEEDVYQ